MTRYAIDAPTLVRLAETGFEITGGDQLVAPRSIRSDALQLLLAEVHAGTRTEKEALALHLTMTELKIRALGDRVSRGTAWRIAIADPGIDLPTAEYVAVAQLQADVLVTADPALLRAAGEDVDVRDPATLVRG
jgi:predicted nucleic acid-binding protein